MSGRNALVWDLGASSPSVLFGSLDRTVITGCPLASHAAAYRDVLGCPPDLV